MAAPVIFRSIAWKVGLPLVLAVALVTYLAVPHVDRVLTEWFRADVELRANLVMKSIEDGLPPLLDQSAAPQIRRYLQRLTADERLLAVLVCGQKGDCATRPNRCRRKSLVRRSSASCRSIS